MIFTKASLNVILDFGCTFYLAFDDLAKTKCQVTS